MGLVHSLVHSLDLVGQLQEPGSISWTKQVCNHKRADFKNKNYFANENLLHVTTVMNLVAILYTECGINMADETSLQLNKQQFEELTDKLLQAGGGEGRGCRRVSICAKWSAVVFKIS
jgi:hypothetical protein